MLKRIFGKKEPVIEGLGSKLDTCPDYLQAKHRFSRSEYLAMYLEGIAEDSKKIEKNPNDGMAYIIRGDAYRGIGEVDLAIADYEKAIEVGEEMEIIMARQAIKDTRERY